MSEFDLLTLNNKIRRYKLNDDFIKIAEYRLKKNKERRAELIGQCHHELMLNIGTREAEKISEDQIVCLVCDSCFAKNSDIHCYDVQKVIDVSSLSYINYNFIVTESKKFLVELYGEYQNKLSINEIKKYLLNYLLELSKVLEEQNIKEMDDDFEKDTYEIMRDYKRKVREKRSNKSS